MCVHTLAHIYLLYACTISLFVKRLERIIMKKTPLHYHIHVLMPSLHLEMIKMSSYTWKALHGKENSGKPQSNSDCFPLWQWAEGFFSGQCVLPALEPLMPETHPSSPAMHIGCFIKQPTQCLVRMRTSHTHLPSQCLSWCKAGWTQLREELTFLGQWIITKSAALKIDLSNLCFK